MDPEAIEDASSSVVHQCWHFICSYDSSPDRSVGAYRNNRVPARFMARSKLSNAQFTFHHSEFVPAPKVVPPLFSSVQMETRRRLQASKVLLQKWDREAQ